MYRPLKPSDLPQVLSGKLKVFYDSDIGRMPAKLIGTRFGKGTDSGWIIAFPTYDYFHLFLGKLIVDVTPEKRYAIWNHKAQRFAQYFDEFGEELKIFTCRENAQIWIDKKIREDARKNYYVVEWEIKNNDPI